MVMKFKEILLRVFLMDEIIPKKLLLDPMI
jgi:hypothetical protein